MQSITLGWPSARQVMKTTSFAELDKAAGLVPGGPGAERRRVHLVIWGKKTRETGGENRRFWWITFFVVCV